MPNDVHVVPINDLREHDADGTCWCKPERDEDGVWRHNSMDGREHTYEKGRTQ